MRCGHRRFFFFCAGRPRKQKPMIICPLNFEIARACPRGLTQWFPCHHLHAKILTTNTGQGYQSCLEPATGVEPAHPAWEAGGLPLTYAGVVPVSPGCHAAASAFALRPMTSGCPASVFPIRFRGFSRASTLWAEIWARIRSVRAAHSNPSLLEDESRECMKCASHVRW